MAQAGQSMDVSTGGRIAYLDIARAVAMLFVVLGHVVAVGTLTKQVVYAFHMPLFFMLSGMVLKPWKAGEKGFFKGLLSKRAMALLVPYAVWGLIYAPFSGKNLLLIAYGSRETLKAAGSLTSLWFLPVMFVASLICGAVLILGSRFERRRYTVIAACMAALCIAGFLMPHQGKFGDPFGFDVALMAAAFMLAGLFVRMLFDRIGSNAWLYLVIVASFLVFVATVSLNQTTEGYVLMANAVYGNPALFLVTALAGSLFVVGICVVLSRIKPGRDFVCGIGQRTLGIFLVHKPLVYFMRDVVKSAGLSYNNLGIALAVSIVVLLASTLVVMLIELVLPEVVGAKRKRGNAANA